MVSHVSTSSVSHDDEDTCARDTPEMVLSVSSESKSECASDDKSELQITFRELYAETLKTKKLNNKLGLKVKYLEREFEVV